MVNFDVYMGYQSIVTGTKVMRSLARRNECRTVLRDLNNSRKRLGNEMNGCNVSTGGRRYASNQAGENWQKNFASKRSPLLTALSMIE